MTRKPIEWRKTRKERGALPGHPYAVSFIFICIARTLNARTSCVAGDAAPARVRVNIPHPPPPAPSGISSEQCATPCSSKMPLQLLSCGEGETKRIPRGLLRACNTILSLRREGEREKRLSICCKFIKTL